MYKTNELYQVTESNMLRAATDITYTKQGTAFKAESALISFTTNNLDLSNVVTKCLYVNTQDNSSDFKVILANDPKLTSIEFAKNPTYDLSLTNEDIAKSLNNNPESISLPFSFLDPTKDTTAAIDNFLGLNSGALKLEQDIPKDLVVTDTSGTWKTADGKDAYNANGPVKVYKDITGDLTSQELNIDLKGTKIGKYEIPYILYLTDSTGTQVIKNGINNIVIKDDVLANFANKNSISIKNDAVGILPININTKAQNAKNINITISTANGMIFKPLGPTTKGVKYSCATDSVGKVIITITPSDQYLNLSQAILNLQFQAGYNGSSTKYKTDILRIEKVTYTLDGLLNTEYTTINDTKKITSYGKIKLR